MNVSVVLEQRFAQTPDGAIWTDGQFPYPFWQRYLEVFDQVTIIARARTVQQADASWLRTSGPNVSLHSAPHYQGMWQYLRQAKQVQLALRDAIAEDSAVVLRIGSQLANIIHPWLLKSKHPFAVEVVADPYDVFSPGAIKHPLRPFFRWHFTRQQRAQCRTAAAASYVTNRHLQQRYPGAENARKIACSSVELPQAAFAIKPRVQTDEGPLRLITVAALSQQHKRIDLLIEATRQVIDRGGDVELTIVGDGRLRQGLEAQARQLGLLDSHIRFTGQLSGAPAVRAELESADLFVMPTKHEGLPRALLEAMAAGLPCIATRVGGIPELLSDDDMVAAGDATSLATKILEVSHDSERRTRMATRNLAEAREYEASILHQRRTEFYRHLRELTAAWVATRRGELHHAD